eukprot:6363930-Prymnesium_polylepis.2
MSCWPILSAGSPTAFCAPAVKSGSPGRSAVNTWRPDHVAECHVAQEAAPEPKIACAAAFGGARTSHQHVAHFWRYFGAA